MNSPEGEVGVNKPNRPGSFWVDTNDGSRIALCFPCSWNRELALRYPRLQYKKQRFSKSLVAVSAHANIRRDEIQTSKNSYGGIIGFLCALALVFLIVMASFSSDESAPPADGYVDEWNAENSVDGPAGTFDDQSKR